MSSDNNKQGNINNLKRLFDECKKDIPDIVIIDKCITHCCKNKEDINTVFRCDPWSHSTILHMACENNHHEIINNLLNNSNRFKFSININYVNTVCHPKDETALFIACHHNFPKTVRALLKHPNIDVNTLNSYYKETPLHHACRHIHELMFKELLKHPNIKVYANDILHDDGIPRFTGKQILLLFEHATIIDINKTDDNGDTPLHKACSRTLFQKRVNVIQMLLKQSHIMIHRKNKNDETPLDICKRRLDNPRYDFDTKYFNMIIQSLKDCDMQRRWRMYFFLINYNNELKK